MGRRFTRHYSLAEARGLLPAVRGWFKKLHSLRRFHAEADQRLSAEVELGIDVGGELAMKPLRLIVEMQQVLHEFHSRSIQIKDLNKGLIDFPSLRDDREILLCYELGEPDIAFWHDLDTGYAGREPIDP